MNSLQRNYLCGATSVALIMCLLHETHGIPRSSRIQVEIHLDPMESIVNAGENVTFTCLSPINATFDWDYSSTLRPDTRITSGISIQNATNSAFHWSKLALIGVKRYMSGEVTCSIRGSTKSAIAFLIVKGVEIGGVCTTDGDCLTQRSACLKGRCSCHENDVLLRLTDRGSEICRKISHMLYDQCEFSEECFHLVDKKSVCSNSGRCVCDLWSVEVNGKCISKSELTYNKNQELYRVGLVAITCLIIIIVAISLWITLKKSCARRNSDAQRRFNSDEVRTERFNSITTDISEDKPPSYDDALETADTVSAPPNFRDALTNSMTAKKLLRQVSAPAGQLLSRTSSFLNPNQNEQPRTDRVT